jgi:hypothetical protein
MAATISHYRLTDDGLTFAIFDTKVHNRVLKPLLATTATRHHFAQRYAEAYEFLKTWTDAHPQHGVVGRSVAIGHR